MSADCVLLCEILQQIQDLRLDRDVERRRRLIGDNEFRLAGKRHRDHGPLAHTTGELVRISADSQGRIGHTHPAEQIARLGQRRGPGCAAVLVDRLADLQADRQRRIERTHRLLENHRDAIAAHASDLVVG